MADNRPGDAPTDPLEKSGGSRRIEFAFGVLALASLLLGLALYLFGERLGLDEATGRLVATAFIIAGVLDAAVLYFWERLFGPRAS